MAMTEREKCVNELEMMGSQARERGEELFAELFFKMMVMFREAPPETSDEEFRAALDECKGKGWAGFFVPALEGYSGE